MKTRKKLLSEIRRLTKTGHDGHKKHIEKIEQNRIKHRTPGIAGLPAGLQNEWDDEI